MAKAFSIDLFKPEWAQWKKNIANFILESIPILYIKKGNRIVEKYEHLKDAEFMTTVAKDESIKLSVLPKGLENIPKTGPVTIVANHPGGPDVVATIIALAKVRPDMAILANELICVPPVRGIVIPVSPISKSKKVDLSLIDDAYKAGKVVVFFAAGKNSRYNEEGLLRDLRWRTSYLDYSQKYKTPINILMIDGKNTPLFYKISKFRNRFKQLKNVPLENIVQLRELMKPVPPINMFFSTPIRLDHDKKYKRRELRKIVNNMYSFLYKMDEDHLAFDEELLK